VGTIKDLDGCLIVRKNIDVLTHVVLFYILHYMCNNGVYFRLEHCAVQPKAEDLPPSQALSLHPSTIAFIGLGPTHVPD
jgi:hypothetical protein